MRVCVFGLIRELYIVVVNQHKSECSMLINASNVTFLLSLVAWPVWPDSGYRYSNSLSSKMASIASSRAEATAKKRRKLFVSFTNSLSLSPPLSFGVSLFGQSKPIDTETKTNKDSSFSFCFSLSLSLCVFGNLYILYERRHRRELLELRTLWSCSTELGTPFDNTSSMIIMISNIQLYSWINNVEIVQIIEYRRLSAPKKCCVHCEYTPFHLSIDKLSHVKLVWSHGLWWPLLNWQYQLHRHLWISRFDLVVRYARYTLW